MCVLRWLVHAFGCHGEGVVVGDFGGYECVPVFGQIEKHNVWCPFISGVLSVFLLLLVAVAYGGAPAVKRTRGWGLVVVCAEGLAVVEYESVLF